MTRRVRTRDAGYRVFIIGHLADGNLHVTVNAPTPIRVAYDKVAPLIYAAWWCGGAHAVSQRAAGAARFYPLH